MFDMILKQKGVEVDAAERDGNTALHKAAEFGYTEMLRDLLENSANVNALNRARETPLIVSIIFNRKECFDIILKRKGVQLDPANNSGKTALHLAAMKRDTAMCLDLLEQGGNVNALALDNYGKTPYEVAVNKECAKMILNEMKKQYFFKIRSYGAGKGDRKPVVFKNFYL